MQTRKCKSCNKRNSIEETLFKWVYSFCDNFCYSNYQKDNKSSPKVKNTIRKVSLKNKNTIASFTSETKAQILIRDRHCIICWNWISDYHHIFYWWQAEYWEDRNNVNKWVWLCAIDHFKIHHWVDWISQELRYKCIDYINNLKIWT
jgi:hypothetical protein